MTRLIDVAPSVDRKSIGSVTAGKCSTVTASARFYVSSKCRFAVGQEALALQGLHFGDMQVRLEQMPQALLRNLAGNAFHAWCCAAVVHSSVELLACCWGKRAANHAQAILGQTNETPTFLTPRLPEAAQGPQHPFFGPRSRSWGKSRKERSSRVAAVPSSC